LRLSLAHEPFVAPALTAQSVHDKKHFNSSTRASHKIKPKSKIMEFRLDFKVMVISQLTLRSTRQSEIET